MLLLGEDNVFDSYMYFVTHIVCNSSVVRDSYICSS